MRETLLCFALRQKSPSWINRLRRPAARASTKGRICFALRRRDEIASQSTQVNVSHSERLYEESDWLNNGTLLLGSTAPLLFPSSLFARAAVGAGMDFAELTRRLVDDGRQRNAHTK